MLLFKSSTQEKTKPRPRHSIFWDGLSGKIWLSFTFTLDCFFFQFFGTKWKLLFMHFHFQWFLQQIKFCSKQASLITKQNKHTLEEFMWRNWYQPSWCISFRVTISFLSQVTWFLLFTLESSGTAAIQRKIFKLFLIVKLLHRHAFMDMDTNMACLDVDNAMNSQSPFSSPGRMWQSWWLQAALMDEIVPCEIMQHNFLFFLFLLYTMTSTSITTTTTTKNTTYGTITFLRNLVQDNYFVLQLIVVIHQIWWIAIPVWSNITLGGKTKTREPHLLK